MVSPALKHRAAIMNLQDAIALINHSDLTEKTNAQWADLGCGSGLFTYALANLLQKGATIHAVDKSPIKLQKLPNPHSIIIHSRQMDFIKDPLPSDGLNGILMANSFHYVANKKHFITTSLVTGVRHSAALPDRTPDEPFADTVMMKLEWNGAKWTTVYE